MCDLIPGTYRCDDCFRPHLLCSACCVSTHLNSPFHRIRHFNGRYFERSDLDTLGIVIDLRPHTHDCHAVSEHKEDLSKADSNDPESSRNAASGQNRPAKSNLIIVSSSGIFKRSVKWCKCANSPEPFVQLFRAKLFPASFTNPSSAFTFEVLDHFRVDALECKTAALNFINKLVRISNEAFPSRVPVGRLTYSDFRRFFDFN